MDLSRARYAGSLRTKMAGKMIGQEQMHPAVQFVVGAAPEAGVRMLMGENPIQAIIGAGVSEYAQGVGQNFSPKIAGEIFAGAPERGEQFAGINSQIAGAGLGMLGSTVVNNMVAPIFREPVNRQQEQPVYASVNGQVVPTEAITYQVTEEDLKRERDRQMRNAAFNRFYADQLAEYPIA